MQLQWAHNSVGDTSEIKLALKKCPNNNKCRWDSGGFYSTLTSRSSAKPRETNPQDSVISSQNRPNNSPKQWKTIQNVVHQSRFCTVVAMLTYSRADSPSLPPSVLLPASKHGKHSVQNRPKLLSVSEQSQSSVANAVQNGGFHTKTWWICISSATAVNGTANFDSNFDSNDRF